ncbi:anti-sigma factor, partial [Micromonospora echinofusca]
VAAGAGAGAWEIQEERVRQERATAEAARLRADEIRAVLAAPDAVLRTEGVAGGGRVTVVASASRDRAVAVLAGLAEPGPGRAYQLWLLDGTGASSSGVLRAGETTTTMLIDGVRGKSRFGVTEEPAGGSAQPTTTPVVLMPVT